MIDQISMVDELIRIGAIDLLREIKDSILVSVNAGVPIELLHIQDREILEKINNYEKSNISNWAAGLR